MARSSRRSGASGSRRIGPKAPPKRSSSHRVSAPSRRALTRGVPAARMAPAITVSPSAARRRGLSRRRARSVATARAAFVQAVCWVRTAPTARGGSAPRAPARPPRWVWGPGAAPPFAVLVAAAHAGGVRSVEDLEGLRVAVTTPGAPELVWFGWLLARTGVSVAQLHLMSLGERGLVRAIDSGEIHAALVQEPMATRLLVEGRATLLADFRTPAGVAKALGIQTVSAGVFVRADRRPADVHLAAFARALLDAQERIRAASAEELAARLPGRETGAQQDFALRLEAARACQLPDGLVS